MKLIKSIVLSVVSAILIGLCISYKLSNQLNKEMETIKSYSSCAKGQIYDKTSKKCQAVKSTLVNNAENPLIFNTTLISPQIVDLLPIFKYDEDRSKK